MEQQSTQQPNEQDQKIAELEAKLKLASQVINELQQHNLKLQQQLVENQETKTHKSTFLTSPAVENSPNYTKENMPKQRPTQAHTSRGKFIRKSRFSKLPYFQFYGIITLVVILILGLFGLSKILVNKTDNKNLKADKNPSANPANIVKTLPNVSVTPLNIPVKIQPISPINSNVQSIPSNSELFYNVTTPPKLKKSEKLDNLVNSLVKYAKEKQLPIEPLSITLIDIKDKTIAGYKGDTGRYPASVVKLFWMVALEAQIKKGWIPLDAAVNTDLNQMMLKSDNDASSRILDRITSTNSSSETLVQEQFQEWTRRRNTVNSFFQNAGYKNINISQKTFPIPYLQIAGPKGADSQIRGDNPEKPKRNKISTYQAARLMYEIFDYQAIGLEYSQQMIDLLTRDLRPAAWKREPPNLDEFNPVENFFGESLATESLLFASKAGWTTASRQEVAYIATRDGKARYILAIFGDDPAYGKSQIIFPEMSRIVFERMTNRNP